MRVSSRQFGIIATDGLRVASDKSATVQIPNKAPMVSISNPGPSTIVMPGGLLVLSGSAVDLEDGGLSDDAYRWSSDVDGGHGGQR